MRNIFLEKSENDEKICSTDQLNKIQKDLIWNRKHAKIGHSTLWNTHENGGLKSVHISNKLISLQCSWIKRLYDTTTHCWKIIPALLVRKKLGKKLYLLLKCKYYSQ